ncbi:unnamed protein product [Urochloa decumbens]|uniref:DUF6598 domain-containing protein n=1 Tax=Urochloa decumbens TaxID=240449 RepID=A0ABC9G2G5_9POAL
MDLLMDISVLLTEKKMDELEELYAKKLAAEQEGVDPDLMARFCKKEGVDGKLMAHFFEYFPGYFADRERWSQNNRDLVFEDITNILAMSYTNQGVPRYVYEGSSNSLQIYSVKVAGSRTQWPLHVFGVVAIRDSIDQNRNLIFNRARDYCQIITEENPYLVLTGPTRAVGMNEPVTIEAELKVKDAIESDDKYLIAQCKTVPLMLGLGMVELTGPGERKLEIAVGGLETCVEATIFVKVIDGTWPVDFHGQLAARTANIHEKVILIEFSGEDVTVSGVDRSMEHLRHVVSVEASGELTVSLEAWKADEEVMTGEVIFKAEMSGRSFSYLKVGSCNLGVLVVWSRIRPMCEELVPQSQMDLCNF